jgi:hypothetical protein
MLNDTVRQIGALPDQACPQGQAVAAVILNPEFIAKSYSRRSCSVRQA